MSNTMPPLPAHVTIPTYSVPTEMGTANIPPTAVFYYAGVSVLWCWYEAELDVLEGYLLALGMKPANFNGKGAVNFSFMSAMGMYGFGEPGNPGGSAFNETEVNIVGYAAAREGNVPTDLSLEDYLFGGDQSKNLGVYRVHVACDSGVAIAAGRTLYYENKFFTSYAYNSPSLNKPVADQLSGADQWSITCYDGAESTDPVIYDATADLCGPTFVGANSSEIIDLSYDKEESRVLGSRRNFFGMFRTAMLSETQADSVKVKYGKSTNQMKTDMERLIGTSRPVAVQVFESPPVIAEAVPYYMDLP